jgi:hypothetical protein
MTITDPQSPNGLWAKHGYTIKRTPRRSGMGNHRTIRDPEGRVVLEDAGYKGEMEWIAEHLEAA